MDYLALNRKYRPQQFAEIIGQDHVTLTLAREVQAGKVAHAYLFAGPRGTGKTTAARILAKALNCTELGIDGEPCNLCPSCHSVTEGTSLDVIELDAASHNKVEDIREIRANVTTVAAGDGARRVYILDEAHMLSRAAANALLKTLEEPPEHAHFVLATTEPYKLLDTIRSRTQRFDFRPIGSEALVEHLSKISERESFRADEAGLALIARHADGSARDALGLLEQVGALGSGIIESKGVTRVLGLVDADIFDRLVDAMADHDAVAALTLVADLAAEGVDLRRFVSDGIALMRGLFLTQYAPNVEEIIDEPAETLEHWRALSNRLQRTDVLRAIEQLGDALGMLREGREERLIVELTILRLVRPETAVDPASLAARIDRLEERIRWLHDAGVKANPVGSTEPDERPPATAVLLPASEPFDTGAGRVAEPALVANDDVESLTEGTNPGSHLQEVEPVNLVLDAVDAAWPALVAKVREAAGPRRYALFRECRPVAVDGSTIALEVPSHLPFHLAQLREDDQLISVISGLAAGIFGGAVSIVYREGSHAATAASSAAIALEVVPDPSELTDAGVGGVEPAELIVDIFGGEVVED